MDGRLPREKQQKTLVFKYMAKSILSLFTGGHDSNLSVFVDNKIITLELERIFGNRYLAFESLPEDEQLGLLDYCKKILDDAGLFRPEYDVGLFDWEAKDETIEMLERFFCLKKIEQLNHHRAHAAGAFYSSGFDNALVVSHDGGGDDGTFCVFDVTKEVGDFTQVNPYTSNPFSTKYAVLGRCISEIRPPDGAPIRQFLQKNQHQTTCVPLVHPRLEQLDQSVAGKIMGLSAYGSFNQDLFDSALSFFRYTDKQGGRTPYDACFWETFGDWAHSGVKGSLAYDLAFNAQRAFEAYFLELFLKFFNPHHHQNVCLTGGGALNVVLNERLSKDFPATNFFVPSSPGDSGLSYGMIAYYLRHPCEAEMMYGGCRILDKGALPYILNQRAWRKATPVLIAQELGKGKIIGICRGDSETGPRALGNRSILADPRSYKAKDIINSKVKFREWYRPFAPVCKEDKASTFFETSANASYKYMSFSPPVREKYRNLLPAVTHVDASSRLQTVSAEQNQFIYSILDEFEKMTGLPVLVNTSFNTRGKAILTRYLTALQTLDSTELDGVVLEGYYICKPQ